MKPNLKPEEEEVYSKIGSSMTKLTPAMFNYRFSEEKIYNICKSLYGMQLIDMTKSSSYDEERFNFAVRKL